MTLLNRMRQGLSAPAIAAPMFLVSGPDLAIAACRSGIVGSFPANNARSAEILDQWMTRIAREIPADGPLWAVNLMVHRTYARMQEELALIVKHRAPIVITALGSPSAVVEAIHGYGGIVLADVNSLTHARKAAAAGVDGLVLIAAGAGGHTGQMSGFAFVPAVREFFDGVIVLGGAITSGRAVRAAEVLGADFAYLGTSLIASTESMAADPYKAMIVEANMEDIVISASLTGAPANWLRQSLIAAGYDPNNLDQKQAMAFGRPEDAEKKRWRDVWSAGHGVGSVKAVAPVAEIVRAIGADYRRACGLALAEGI